MCEELPGRRGSLPNFAMPISAACAEPALGTQSAFLQISHSAKQKSREIKMTRGAGVLGHLSTAVIGRADGGLAQFTRGSRNVKMVDGKPTQPRDSVFAASQAIVSVRCSLFQVTGLPPGDGTQLLSTQLRQACQLNVAQNHQFGHIGLLVPQNVIRKGRFSHAGSTRHEDPPKIFPILVKAG